MKTKEDLIKSIEEDIPQIVEEVVGGYDAMGLDWTANKLTKKIKKWLSLYQNHIREAVEKELKPYKILDDPKALAKSGFYQGPAPLTEYVFNQDKGYKKALEWMLEKFLMM